MGVFSHAGPAVQGHDRGITRHRGPMRYRGNGRLGRDMPMSPSVAESNSEWRFGLRRGVGRADTVAVIGGEFAAVLAAAQGGDQEAYARLFRDIQPVLL